MICKKAIKSMVISPSSDNEIREVCFSKSTNESPRYDKISFIVIKNRFGALYELLKYLFNLSICENIFSNDLKIAKLKVH